METSTLTCLLSSYILEDIEAPLLFTTLGGGHVTPQHMEEREHPTLGLTPALHQAGLCYLSLLCFLYPGITTGPQKTIKKD